MAEQKSMPKQKCQVVFEISNEVGNKIGGIYTVIASKAPEMQKLLGPGNYLAIGLFNAFKARNDFEELETPREFEEVFNQLRLEGITAKYGLWLGGGGVETILLDPSYLLDVPLITGKPERRIDQIKGFLWDWYKIDSLWMSEVFDPMVAFGWAAGVLISYLVEMPRFKNKNIVAHFHEWISGPGLLYLKKHKVGVGTVFMTHATQLGRNIAMSNEDINVILDELLQRKETIPPEKAYQYHVEGSHQIEVLCAQKADTLITVSEAVARETEVILGKRADFVIPNGINFNTIATSDNLLSKHLIARGQLARFVEAYFNPYYKLQFEDLMIIHISGRYEFHNKGIDVFLEALEIINRQLKSQKAEREVLAFIWVPAPVSGIKPIVSKAFEIAKKHRSLIERPLMRMNEWLSYTTHKFEEHIESKTLREFFTEEEIAAINALALDNPLGELQEEMPPICPFIINERDTIFQTLKKLNLTNKPSDKVKVIFYPIYLSKMDQLLELDYYDAVAGCDMGVYPSTYEPYGLTPLEALALGVPAITTDLSGFGLLVNELSDSHSDGIHILRRKGRTSQEAANELATIILKQLGLSKKALENARVKARKIAEIYSWENIIHAYKKAYDTAIQKTAQKKE
ncbi:MAG: glycosyltransferase [Candidatus Heimdallarchaeota archaeon]|nr:glycosyltransferase [Candidatus Heimdallarchaeota archaeon]